MNRQHDQVYSNKYGPPFGRPGNGLGDVWGGLDEGGGLRRPRPTDHGAPDIEDESVEPDHLDELHEAIGRLTAKQAFVLRLRHGLTDGVEYKLEEIASLMGVTNQAVSKIEQVALKRLEKLVKDG
jgi:RNA polymerase sporulation-specific sigma factor